MGSKDKIFSFILHKNVDSVKAAGGGGGVVSLVGLKKAFLGLVEQYFCYDQNNIRKIIN